MVMNPSALLILWVALMLFGLVMSGFFFSFQGDPFVFFRYLSRILVVVPLVTFLAIGSLRLFDHFTPPVKWLEKVAENEIAIAILLASIVYGIFWCCIQG
jgi:hypothetical protein